MEEITILQIIPRELIFSLTDTLGFAKPIGYKYQLKKKRRKKHFILKLNYKDIINLSDFTRFLYQRTKQMPIRAVLAICRFYSKITGVVIQKKKKKKITV